MEIKLGYQVCIFVNKYCSGKTNNIYIYIFFFFREKATHQPYKFFFFKFLFEIINPSIIFGH